MTNIFEKWWVIYRHVNILGFCVPPKSPKRILEVKHKKNNFYAFHQPLTSVNIHVFLRLENGILHLVIRRCDKNNQLVMGELRSRTDSSDFVHFPTPHTPPHTTVKQEDFEKRELRMSYSSPTIMNSDVFLRLENGILHPLIPRSW